MALTNARIALLAAQRARAWNASPAMNLRAMRSSPFSDAR